MTDPTDKINTRTKALPAKYPVFFGIALGLVLMGGCATVRVTYPVRTATEQFLLSEAARAAVEPLTFEALRGRKVFVESAYFAPAEKEFVLAELRAKLLTSGAQLKTDVNEADIIMEVRSGGVGIDHYESLFGLPSFVAPTGPLGGVSGLSSIVTPEIAITKDIKQLGFASVSYVAYRANTGEVVTSAGPSVGKSFRDDWWFLGYGPRTLGNVPTVDHRTKD